MSLTFLPIRNSSQPTALPTSNPTSLPTNNPTNAIETTVYCPTEAGTSVTLTAGTKSFARSTAASFCGIFIELESGDLIPYARSYSANDWEPAGGPLAAPYSGIECSEQACTVELLVPSSGSYVIMMKPTNALDNKAKIARFLEMTSFGTTAEELASLDVGTFGEIERADAVRAQMDQPKTSHREYFRVHANPKVGAYRHVCIVLLLPMIAATANANVSFHTPISSFLSGMPQRRMLKVIILVIPTPTGGPTLIPGSIEGTPSLEAKSTPRLRKLLRMKTLRLRSMKLKASP